MEKPAFLDRVWQQMGAVHKDSDLAAACLVAQERFAADVPLLLLLCLADQHRSAPALADLPAYFAGADAWRQAVIVPIRAVRQTMKTAFNAPAELQLRDEIKRVELEAERLHVVRLVQSYPTVTTDQTATAPIYLARCQAPDDQAQAFLSTFAAAFDAQIRLATAKA